MKRRYMDPEFKAVRDECSRIAAAKRVAKPGERERLAQWGRTVGVKNFSAAQTPEARAKAARSSSATKLAHIPPAYRALYRSIRAQNIPAPEAERMVLEQQQADRRNAPSLVAANENAMREKHRREVESRY